MAAFVSEIVRGAVAAIPRSATDAARSLGMPPALALRRVVLPLAARAALPPLVNRAVMAIKSTSLASAVGLWELSLAGREIIQRDLAPFQVFGLIALLYFCLCMLVARAGRRLEARFAYEH
jgi:polar amino acid transport system permease protein